MQFATKDEAYILREAGIKEEILLLTPNSNKEDIKKLIDNDIILTLSSKEDAKSIESVGKELNKKIRVHLKNRYRVWKIWFYIFK